MPTSRFSPSFSLCSFSFYPVLPRAILSSRICDHQHAKWIKFLDYTFCRPFFTRFRFLYPVSSSFLPSPRVTACRRPVSRRSRIPDCFSAPTNICTTYSTFHPCFRSRSLFLFLAVFISSSCFCDPAFFSVFSLQPADDLFESGRGFTAYRCTAFQLF